MPKQLPIKRVEVELEGKHYPLAYTFGAFRLAEADLAHDGIAVDFFSNFDWASVGNAMLPALTRAAMYGGGTKLDLEEINELLDGLQGYQLSELFSKLVQAYSESCTPPEKRKKGNVDADDASKETATK